MDIKRGKGDGYSDKGEDLSKREGIEKLRRYYTLICLVRYKQPTQLGN